MTTKKEKHPDPAVRLALHHIDLEREAACGLRLGRHHDDVLVAGLHPGLHHVHVHVALTVGRVDRSDARLEDRC